MFLAAWETLCQLAPWLLLGALLAGLLHVLLPPDFLRRHLTGRRGVLRAVLLGVPLPLCSCGVIPAGVGLKKDGADDGACLGFLISTPQTGVDSILVSASFFGWPFALFKMLVAGVTGWVGGSIANCFPNSETTDSSESRKSQPRSLTECVSHAVEVIRSIYLWLLLGIAISVVISEWMPQSAWTEIGRWGVWQSMLLVLIVSIPLYVCATASVPIAAALVAGGLPAGAAIVFLIAGPATNVATLGAVHNHFGFRVTAIYLTTIVVGSFAGGFLFDWLIGSGQLAQGVVHVEHDGWLAQGSAILLAACFVWFSVGDIRKLLRRARRRPSVRETMNLQVSGLSCQNCVDKLERALLAKAGVTSVAVDLSSGRLSVAGKLARHEVLEVVKQAGFEPGPDVDLCDTV